MSMRKSFVLPLLLLAWPSPAQEPESRPTGPESRPQTPKEQIAAIDAELQAGLKTFYAAYDAAKTDEEKSTAYKDRYPKPETWFPRLFEIARSDPKGPGAEAALIWIVTHDRAGKGTPQALDVLERDHLESERLGDIAEVVGSRPSARSERFLKLIEEKSPHRSVKGRALYARAGLKKNLSEFSRFVSTLQGDALKEFEDEHQPEDLALFRSVDADKTAKEVEELLVLVKDRYADVDAPYGGTLGDRAGGDLFEIRFLAIGKVAPDIEGEGIDGRPLKLSDFKGKVVVLDFWGNW
jgi:hypothetical protein